MTAKAFASVLGVALISSLLAGCSTAARRVDCSGRLQPINRPAPKTLANVEADQKPEDGAIVLEGSSR